jgi:hypothetical protein
MWQSRQGRQRFRLTGEQRLLHRRTCWLWQLRHWQRLKAVSQAGRVCHDGVMERVLTSVAICNTEGNDRVGICSGWAGLGYTIANTVAKVDIGAEAERIRLAVLRRAAESGCCREHVVDTDLLRNGLGLVSSAELGCELGSTYTACREGRNSLGRGEASEGSDGKEGLHGGGGRMRLRATKRLFQVSRAA